MKTTFTRGSTNNGQLRPTDTVRSGRTRHRWQNSYDCYVWRNKSLGKKFKIKVRYCICERNQMEVSEPKTILTKIENATAEFKSMINSAKERNSQLDDS